MRGVILPRRDGKFSLKYDSGLCKRFVGDLGDVRVPALYNNSANSNKDAGIYVHSSYNTLINNTATLNGFGMWIRGSNNTLRNNTILGSSKYNFDASSIQDIDTSNKINGKPIRYLVHEKDLIIDSNLDVGYLGIVNSRNITVRDLILTTNLIGIRLDYSRNSKIENVTVLNCESGLALKSSSNNAVTNNNASNNIVGIHLGGSSSKNTVGNNNCLYNSRGIELSASSSNILTNNIFNSNNERIAIFSSSNNKIYLNNFINNTDNVYPSTSSNIWNSAEEISYTYNGNTYTNYMGNYWSDYSGNDTNDDGIGDIPYGIDSDQDNCPLMQPWENYLWFSTWAQKVI
jgi:parallel beta-helix repeat protein